MRQLIYGQVPSKSNAYKIVNHRIYKREDVIAYEKDFAAQWVNKGAITGRFALTLHIWFRSDLSDLDGAFKIILDNLQVVGAIRNDRDCMIIRAEKYVDKQNPRCDIELIEL